MGKFTIIKLGGSVITSENSHELFNKWVVRRIAGEIKGLSQGLILVHGTGHVGKPMAVKYGYAKSGRIEPELKSVALDISESIRMLNKKLTDELSFSGIQSSTIDISYFNGYPDGIFNKRAIRKRINDLKRKKCVPVFYGDHLEQIDGSYKVVSSDEIVLLLSDIFKPEKVGFFSDVDGVFENYQSTNEALIKYIRKGDLSILGSVQDTELDVSGGMKSKLAIAFEVLNHTQKCYIGNGFRDGVIRGFLENEEPIGTYISTNE
jgi:isopentenyl phosphate kinase